MLSPPYLLAICLKKNCASFAWRSNIIQFFAWFSFDGMIPILSGHKRHKMIPPFGGSKLTPSLI